MSKSRSGGPPAPVQPQTSDGMVASNGKAAQFWRAVKVSPGSGVTILVFIAPALAVAALWNLRESNMYLAAPLQIVLGSVAFLGSILAIVVVFARLGLYDASKALGLPSGTVRALIALILLIILSSSAMWSLEIWPAAAGKHHSTTCQPNRSQPFQGQSSNVTPTPARTASLELRTTVSPVRTGPAPTPTPLHWAGRS